MTRRSRVLLTIGLITGSAILANTYFRTQSAPSESAKALSPGEDEGGPTEKQVDRAPRSLKEEVAALLEERRELDETVWAREVAAQKYEETIVKYWDQMLRPEDDRYAVLADFPFQTITLDAPGETEELDWSIKRTNFEGQWKTLDREGWRDFLREMKNRGHDIKAIEFHHSEFDVDLDGNTVSVFRILLNVANEKKKRRWTVQTKLQVEWSKEKDEDGLHLPGKLQLFDTTILEREGPPVFEHRVLDPDIRMSSHPVVHDLNRDGLSDILLPVDNSILWNRGEGQFDKEPLYVAPGVAPPTEVWTATAADFTRDGYTDLIITGRYDTIPRTDSSPPDSGLFLFRGDASGRFTAPGERVASRSLTLIMPIVRCSW